MNAQSISNTHTHTHRDEEFIRAPVYQFIFVRQTATHTLFKHTNEVLHLATDLKDTLRWIFL